MINIRIQLNNKTRIERICKQFYGTVGSEEAGIWTECTYASKKCAINCTIITQISAQKYGTRQGWGVKERSREMTWLEAGSK